MHYVLSYFLKKSLILKVPPGGGGGGGGENGAQSKEFKLINI